MTFSFPGSLTSHLLTAIGLSLAISTGIGKYSVIVRSLLHKGQLVMRLLLMYMCSPLPHVHKKTKAFLKATCLQFQSCHYLMAILHTAAEWHVVGT